MQNITDVLMRDGLTVDRLASLSVRSSLAMSLKKNLHYFDREQLLADACSARRWLLAHIMDYDDIHIDYRIKSVQSIRLKYSRYYPDHQAGKVFNDIVGFRTLCDDYAEVLALSSIEKIKIIDMSGGKAHDDGYHGVHVYYQLDNHHYPVEIQYNTYYDRQINNWLHKYTYKKGYASELCCSLRASYELGEIKNEREFKEALDDVLYHSEKL